jgi:uncharacterized protein (TIGR03437 family)
MKSMRLSIWGIFLIATSCLAQTAPFTYPGISPLRPSGSGGRVTWSAVLNLVAYDRLSANGYYDIHTMNPDGSNDQCLTCNVAALPNRHKGNPSFDYSGKWIIFEAEKNNTSTLFDMYAAPGSGLFNDVWMMDVKGTVFYQLTNVPASNSGVLHPHFNHAGTQITWAQYLGSSPAPLGLWEVQVASLVYTAGVPSLQNIQSYQFGPMPRFYETHGFSLDDKSIYVCANPDPAQTYYGADIYVFTPSTGAYVDLTNTPDDWDEHADLSPDGTQIVWVSSTGIQLSTGNETTDYWIMNVDGSNKRRLTWFNNPGYPETQTSAAAAAASAWSPDGTYFLGYVVTDNFGDAGPIVSVDLVTPVAQVSTATFQPPPIAPDSIVALFSRNMSATSQPDTALPLPTLLGTTNVVFTDATQTQYQAQLYYVGPGQINYYVPSGAAPGLATVSVFRNGGGTGESTLPAGALVASGTVQVQSVDPGIYTANGSGSGVPAAVYLTAAGGTVSAADVFTCTGGAGTCTPVPINLGGANTQVAVELFGTGIRHKAGAVTANAVTAAGVVQPLTVLYAGAQSTQPGLDQVNLQIPQTLAGSGTVTINLVVNGVAVNPVQLAFQ